MALSVSTGAQMPALLRRQVTSDLETLQQLHEETGWTPGRENIRPNPASRAQKDLLLSNINAMWSDPADWVSARVRQPSPSPHCAA